MAKTQMVAPFLQVSTRTFKNEKGEEIPYYRMFVLDNDAQNPDNTVLSLPMDKACISKLPEDLKSLNMKDIRLTGIFTTKYSSSQKQEYKEFRVYDFEFLK